MYEDQWNSLLHVEVVFLQSCWIKIKKDERFFKSQFLTVVF